MELTIGAALLLVGIFQVLLPVLRVTGPLPPPEAREVVVDTAARLPGVTTSGTVTLRGTHYAELAVSNPGLGQRLLLVLPEAVGGLLVVVILTVLLQMARTFRHRDFFVPQNTWRLAIIAGALMLTGAFVPLTEMMTTNLLARATPMAEAITPNTNYHVGPMFLALLVGATSAAFQNGARLRADTEGLV
ncbi:DUF2975 domain-containing protein [Streptomyces sp. NBRC 110611]|uniref:DUF2975 domain-containing protein n=1 Tax=Streptomyces sp. NBRC 110611 TaxID=1621259 RepID=UPI0015EF3FCB|nr:DUF2975 domain-containing protein [Streptomyces sp. NBRC 110611]